jgi:hypothetical protein
MMPNNSNAKPSDNYADGFFYPPILLPPNPLKGALIRRNFKSPKGDSGADFRFVLISTK